MKLWVGLEKEGKYKGVKTLFIGSKSITFQDIVIAIQDRPDICQLYFGAGVCTAINEDVVKKCLNTYETFVITLEIDIKQIHKYNKNILQLTHLIVTNTHKNYSIVNELSMENRIQIKVQSLEKNKEIVALGKMNEFSLTNVDELEGKIYTGDIKVK